MKENLKELYDKLSWEDKWRIQLYIWNEIQYPLIIKNLIENELLPKNFNKDASSTKNELNSLEGQNPEIAVHKSSESPDKGTKPQDTVHSQIKQEIDKDYVKTNESVGGKNDKSNT